LLAVLATAGQLSEEPCPEIQVQVFQALLTTFNYKIIPLGATAY
jgi:hypothetical protein